MHYFRAHYFRADYFGSAFIGGGSAGAGGGGDFTVSGEEVVDRFTHQGVTYTFAAITRRTN